MQTYHPPTPPEVLVTIHTQDSPVTWTPEKVLAWVTPAERHLFEQSPTLTHMASLLMNISTAGQLRVRAEKPHKAIQKALPRRRRQSREASLAAVADVLREHPDWKRGRIAEACGLSPSYVGALLRELRGAAVKEATLAAIARHAEEATE